MEPTTRDLVWDAALRLAVEADGTDSNGFTIDDVLVEAALEESKRRTAYRTVKSMVTLGWIESDHGSPQYHLARDPGYRGFEWELYQRETDRDREKIERRSRYPPSKYDSPEAQRFAEAED